MYEIHYISIFLIISFNKQKLWFFKLFTDWIISRSVRLEDQIAITVMHPWCCSTGKRLFPQLVTRQCSFFVSFRLPAPRARVYTCIAKTKVPRTKGSFITVPTLLPRLFFSWRSMSENRTVATSMLVGWRGSQWA